MNYKITILVDNYLSPPLEIEHGFSALIEYKNKRILFDTGQNNALFTNAKILNIDLNNIDFLILSHGHYDHGGNIAKIINLNPDIQIIVHQNACIPRYSIHPDKPVKNIGLSKQNKIALIEHPNIIWCSKPLELLPCLWVSGEILRKTDFEDCGGPFYLDTNKQNPDFIEDDMSICIIDNNQLNIICGCCHSGIVNTIDWFKKLTGLDDINSVQGGLHLLHSDTNRLNKTFDYLSKNVKTIHACHCTGTEAINSINQL